MPKVAIDKLKNIFAGAEKLPIFKESNDLYNAIRTHANGEYPEALIDERRPSEPEEIKAYRKAVYKPVTKKTVSRVFSSLGKIRRSADYMIDYPEKSSAKIVDSESLKQYCEYNLGGFVSITNWAFDILLKQNLIDANAVVAVIPFSATTNEAEYLKPLPILFNSDQVFWLDEEFAVLRSKLQVNGQNEFYYIDNREVTVFSPVSGGFTVKNTILNPFNEMPVFRVRAEYYKQMDRHIINRSRIDSMVPFLDEAIAEYSDLKGSKIQHLYPLFWYYQNEECKACSGVGSVPGENGKTECKSCGGDGKVKFSPFAHLKVQAAQLGQQQLPTPPAGYIARDTVILELQEKSYRGHCFEALSAVNMQFLDQTPLSISGDAKQVDREELNNFVYNIAEDIIFSIDKVIHFINEWRYSFIVPDRQKRLKQLPKVPVPQNFDLLPEDYLMKEVTDAKSGKINPLLVATLEQQLAAKKFYNKPDLAQNIDLMFDLDPLPGYSVDDKMALLTNQAITKKDFILSSYLASFIKRAIREHREFSTMDYDGQMKILMKYVDEKEKANDEVAAIQNDVREKIMLEMNGKEAETANQ
ncbi:hypothetical protein ABDK00_014055 [Niabella insulamsoli]|uniref:hypothetical protein n=1 Tax=Niabella insulamsoli TaxID=3144874 RepID=UPI0031FC9780